MISRDEANRQAEQVVESIRQRLEAEIRQAMDMQAFDGRVVSIFVWDYPEDPDCELLRYALRSYVRNGWKLQFDYVNHGDQVGWLILLIPKPARPSKRSRR